MASQGHFVDPYAGAPGTIRPASSLRLLATAEATGPPSREASRPVANMVFEHALHRPASLAAAWTGGLAAAQTAVGLYLDRSEYALTVNVSGLWPVEQISHPKSTCPIPACQAT
jgi:hypothetical protein